MEAHAALSLSSRDERGEGHQITAFLRRGSTSTLSSLLAAFDAIPEAWIDEYHLQIVMRHAGQIFPEMVANSYHADHVRLIGEDLSTPGSTSSAPRRPCSASRTRPSTRVRSRRRIDFGIATVVLRPPPSPRSVVATSAGCSPTSRTPRRSTSRCTTRSGSPT